MHMPYRSPNIKPYEAVTMIIRFGVISDDRIIGRIDVCRIKQEIMIINTSSTIRSFFILN